MHAVHVDVTLLSCTHRMFYHVTPITKVQPHKYIYMLGPYRCLRLLHAGHTSTLTSLNLPTMRTCVSVQNLLE